jgi:hypothetical protein
MIRVQSFHFLFECRFGALCQAPTSTRTLPMRDDEFLALQAAKKAAKLAKKKANASVSGDAAPAAAAEPAASSEPATDTPEKKRKKPEAAASSSWDGAADESLYPPKQDEQRWCTDCGGEFTFTVGEQNWWAEKGYTGGRTRCAECTAAKKQRCGDKYVGRGAAAAERAAKTQCYTCGKFGHKTSECPDSSCYNCGKQGHRSKDCNEPRLNQAGGGVCMKFQTGACTRGDACRFAHVLDPSAVRA